MPDNPIAGLYPQPAPQQQNSLLSSPFGMLELLGQARAQQQFNAQKAAGNALLAARNPDGTVDYSKFVGGLGPNAALVAPQAIENAQAIQGAAQDIFNKNYGIIATRMAPFAQGGANPGDVEAAFTALARSGVVPPAMIAQEASNYARDPQGTMRNYASYVAGPVAAGARTTGPLTAEGAPTSVPFVSTLGTQYPTGLSVPEQASITQYTKDQGTSAELLSTLRPLQNALPIISQLSNSSFGPGSPQEAHITGLLSNLGVLDPNTTNLPLRERVNKYLLQYARGSHSRSDEELATKLASNPNLDMTQPANLALIKNQISMDREDAALQPSFTGNKREYNAYRSRFYQNNDQRAFSFDLLNPTEQSQLIKSLKPGSPEQQKFNTSLNNAVNAGILDKQEVLQALRNAMQ